MSLGCLGTLVTVQSPLCLTFCLPLPHWQREAAFSYQVQCSDVGAGQIRDSMWAGTEGHSSVVARTNDCPWWLQIRNDRGLPRVVFHTRQAARCWVG